MSVLWKRFPCSRCRGYGVVDVGYDQVKPADCPDCGGSRMLYVSEHDRVAEWPGGPWVGRWPLQYSETPGPAMTWADWIKADEAESLPEIEEAYA